MPDIFELESTTTIETGSSYIVSYPYLRSYFAARGSYGKEEFVNGAHMVYGWMPTALDLYPNPPNIGLEAGARLLTKAKVQGSLTNAEIQQLADLVNRSVVGASKLLHFAAPTSFAIWDSKIYRFLHKRPGYHYRVDDIEAYRDYLQQLEDWKRDERFPKFHAAVNGRLGYEVSALRALELVAFLNAPEVKAPSQAA